jgi:hypothetical protein
MVHGDRGFISGLMFAGLFLAAAITADLVQAQTTSVGPYYATPAWDQTLPSDTRFIILSNFNGAAVLDRNTGLVWERSPGDTNNDNQIDENDLITWPTARINCVNKTVGGQRGWRLPSFPELASLMDPSATNPSLPAGHPFQNIPTQAVYLTATTDKTDATKAWLVFSFNDTVFSGQKDVTNSVWCVRSTLNENGY